MSATSARNKRIVVVAVGSAAGVVVGDYVAQRYVSAQYRVWATAGFGAIGGIVGLLLAG